MDRGFYCTKQELVDLLCKIYERWPFALFSYNHISILRLPLSLEMYTAYISCYERDHKFFRDLAVKPGEFTAHFDAYFSQEAPLLAYVCSEDAPLTFGWTHFKGKRGEESYYSVQNPDPFPIQLFIGGEISPTMIVETRFRARPDEKTESLRKVVDSCLRKSFTKFEGVFLSSTAMELYRQGGRLNGSARGTQESDVMEPERAIRVWEELLATGAKTIWDPVEVIKLLKADIVAKSARSSVLRGHANDEG